MKRCGLHKNCDHRHAWIRDGLCDVCTACTKGVRRCRRCECIDYEHNRKKCDGCLKLIAESLSSGPDARLQPFEEQRAGPEFKMVGPELEQVTPRTYCLVCIHFKKKPENKKNNDMRSSRLREERLTGFWPGLVQMRLTLPDYVDKVEAEFQKYYEAPGSTTDLILLMARLGVYCSDEMKLQVYKKWKRRCGYIK